LSRFAEIANQKHARKDMYQMKFEIIKKKTLITVMTVVAA
jgi:hypothetical protein